MQHLLLHPPSLVLVTTWIAANLSFSVPRVVARFSHVTCARSCLCYRYTYVLLYSQQIN